MVFQVLDGLAFLHSLGIIHRDLRADNVLVASIMPLRVLIADFGIAHQLSTTAVSAGTGSATASNGPYGRRSIGLDTARYLNFGPIKKHIMFFVTSACARRTGHVLAD